MNYKYIYRVTHKGWDLRDDCTEFLQSVFLNSGFRVGQNWHISVLDHLVYDQSAETKNKASNRNIFRAFRVVFTVLSFEGIPVYALNLVNLEQYLVGSLGLNALVPYYLPVMTTLMLVVRTHQINQRNKR